MPPGRLLRILFHGPFVGPLEGKPLPLQVLADPMIGQPHPVQLRYEAPTSLRVHNCPTKPTSHGR
jgi:hypothetical protein